MIDDELSAALRAHREAAAAWRDDRRTHVPDPVPFEARFAAVVGADRAPELQERIAALWREARAVPDPTGSIMTGYWPLLRAWAATHPEIDSAELDHITDAMLFEAR